ncbi:glycosyltransferase [Alphaproteobacteria bacterium]|nr:glycosyltransferase [Alphaproteobacteria bacterium]
MAKKPLKVSIIARTFWPVYPVIGEALLRFAEDAVTCGHSVSVIMQDNTGIKGELAEAGRGNGIQFYPANALTTSASRISYRVYDAFFFMFWVLAVLLWVRPNKIYVSTDPPVIVPFFVMLYSRLSGAEFVYHLQDIHPEATNAAMPLNKWLFYTLVKIDALSMRKAHCLITITEEMASEIRSRSGTNVPIHIVNNPSISFDEIDVSKPKIAGFAFCGNAGRLQRIPLMLEAIENYFEQGGKQAFAFAGGGIYANQLRAFADKHPKFHFAGQVSPTEAAQLNADYAWALLPIEDSVTRFAFPSKSSSYVFSDANILAVCGEQTSVARWVRANRVGEVVKPEIKAVTDAFFAIEKGAHAELGDKSSREALRAKLRFEVFVKNLIRIILG